MKEISKTPDRILYQCPLCRNVVREKINEIA